MEPSNAEFKIGEVKAVKWVLHYPTQPQEGKGQDYEPRQSQPHLGLHPLKEDRQLHGGHICFLAGLQHHQEVLSEEESVQEAKEATLNLSLHQLCNLDFKYSLLPAGDQLRDGPRRLNAHHKCEPALHSDRRLQPR